MTAGSHDASTYRSGTQPAPSSVVTSTNARVPRCHAGQPAPAGPVPPESEADPGSCEPTWRAAPSWSHCLAGLPGRGRPTAATGQRQRPPGMTPGKADDARPTAGTLQDQHGRRRSCTWQVGRPPGATAWHPAKPRSPPAPPPARHGACGGPQTRSRTLITNPAGRRSAVLRAALPACRGGCASTWRRRRWRRSGCATS